MKRSALVTGATGGLGRHLIKRLISEGYSVRATGRNTEVGEILKKQGAEFIAQDLTNPQEIAPLVKGQDVIFHCAALSSPWGKYEDFYAINVTATENLLKATVRQEAEAFIYVSTPSIYFQYKDALDIKEDSPLPERAVNHYAATKAIAESLLKKYGNKGLKTISIRPRALFGEYDDVIIPRILKTIRRGKFPVFRKGQTLMDITYTGNVAEALLLCDIHRDKADGHAFNITNGEQFTSRDLLNKLFDILNMDIKLLSLPFSLVYAYAATLEKIYSLLPGQPEPPVTRYSAATMAFNQTLDISAARNILGYNPSVSVDEGLQRYASWRKQNA